MVQAAMSRRTLNPAFAARSTHASRLKFWIRPRERSFSRGCVTPSLRAASVGVMFQPRTLCSIAIDEFDRSAIDVSRRYGPYRRGHCALPY